jgi:hypothetical protein
VLQLVCIDSGVGVAPVLEDWLVRKQDERVGMDLANMQATPNMGKPQLVPSYCIRHVYLLSHRPCRSPLRSYPTHVVALLDDVYRAAFRGSPLGRGLVFPASRIGKVNAAMVAEFRAQFVTGPNTVVSGVGTNMQPRWISAGVMHWCM